MRSAVFVGIRKRQLIAKRVFLEKFEGVAETDIIVCLGAKPGRTKSEPNITNTSVDVPDSPAISVEVPGGL